MQTYLKAIYAAVIAGLGATGASLAAGNNHIGWQAGITIAITTVTALGGVWGVTNSAAK